LESFLVSTGVVALAEIGDKTQLLSLLLAARFRRPWPIVAGILVATLVNHAFAGVVGHWVGTTLRPDLLRWLLGVAFLAMAIWVLVPDKVDDDCATVPGTSVFAVTLLAFFFAEMGDKTQIATVALAAQYASLAAVVVGTTAGMMLANVPAVLLGERMAGRLPVKRVHQVAAAIFALLGIMTLLGADTAVRAIGERL